MLDKTLWIFAYKMASKSAKLLAQELDVFQIRHEKSDWHGKPDRFVLNWGAGTGVFTPDVKGATVWNTPHQIDLAVNKLDFFRAMGEGPDSPRVPWWTSEKAVAKRWLNEGKEVVARTELEGCKGSGLVLMKKPLDFVDARLYTIKERSTAEYRVYMFDGKVIDSRIKCLIRGQKANPDGMRYHEETYEFCRHGDALPRDVARQAEKAIKKIGLMTGGVDVLWDANVGEAVVLEVNTAPFIGGQTAERYATAIKKYLKVA